MTRFLHGLGHALFAGFMATAWSALALADLGRFSAWPCVVLGLLVALAVYYFARREMDNGHPPSQAETLASGAAAIIAAGTLFLSLPPSEMVLGGWDPGVYMHTAAAVSRGGSLRIDDPDLASLGPRERQVVARDLFGVVEPFGGMRVLPNGKTSPEFHHLYPSFLAVAYSAGGIRAAQAVNPLLCAVAVILIFLLAKRMLGSGAALMAALLLAMNPAQVWQAGFSTAEPLTQVLLLGGLLYLGPALEGRSMLDAILCGAAFGLALLARYDTVLLLVPLTLVVIVAWQRPLSTSHAQVAAGVFALVLLHLFLHQRYVAP
ncbi:MAG TPA: glycosyltransferase family 39 protein, partial [Kiritimatiellia bacterium]